jgi:DNA-directed RNA polymerase specialized sigma24 family protein
MDWVLNDRVAEYRGLVESLAERYDPNEYDDVVQEGLIDVWRTLQKGATPSAENIEKRMIDWLRFRNRQLRHAPADPETLLPLGELRDANSQHSAVRQLPGHGPDADE